MRTIIRNITLALMCPLALLFSGCGTDNTPPDLGGGNPASSGLAPVAATGQKACYNTAGLAIDCTGTGQDGELRKGVPEPNPRFTDHGDGTVTDNLTGLMWLKYAGCPTATTWQGGFVAAAAFNANPAACGVTANHHDWRVPNRRELQSLINFGYTDLRFTDVGGPAISNTAGSGPMPWGDPFDTNRFLIANAMLYSDGYMASTPGNGNGGGYYMYSLKGRLERGYATSRDWDHNNLWLVRTDTGAAPPAPLPATGKTSCVDILPGNWLSAPIDCAGTGQDGELRAGIPLLTPRFKDNKDGTITDKLTGLMWLKEANCIGDLLPGLDLDDTPGDGKITWQHALDFVAGLNYGAHACGQTSNYTDWRLPNVLELDSLINQEYGVSNRAGTGKWRDNDPFLGLKEDYYWSSTSQQLTTGAPFAYARVINMATGDMDAANLPHSLKTAQNLVWPVRGGK